MVKPQSLARGKVVRPLRMARRSASRMAIGTLDPASQRSRTPTYGSSTARPAGTGSSCSEQPPLAGANNSHSQDFSEHSSSISPYPKAGRSLLQATQPLASSSGVAACVLPSSCASRSYARSRTSPGRCTIAMSSRATLKVDGQVGSKMHPKLSSLMSRCTWRVLERKIWGQH